MSKKKTEKPDKDVSTDRVAEAFASLMIDKIKALQLDWKKPWVTPGFTGMPQNITGRHYNGINALMLMLLREKEGYKTPVFMTFQQAKGAGYDVKKGAAGYPVEFWRPVFKDENGRRLTYEEYDDLSDEQKKRCTSYPVSRVHIVFNAEQTRMPEVDPERWQKLLDTFSPARLNDTAGMLRSPELDLMLSGQTWLCPVKVQQSDKAFYSPSTDSITLPLKAQFDTGEHFYGTLLHEMAHSTGIESRLGREMGGGFGSLTYGREELVAEMTAAMTASQLGIAKGIEDDNVAYLQGWLKAIHEEPDFIRTLMADINKASGLIQQTVLTPEVAEQVKQEAIASLSTFMADKQHEAELHTAPLLTEDELRSRTASISPAGVSQHPTLAAEVMDAVSRVHDKAPDAAAWVILGDDIHIVGADAKAVAKTLKLSASQAYTPDGALVDHLVFDRSKLDVFLPQVIRKGHRVVIDQVSVATVQQALPQTTGPKLHMAHLGNGISVWEDGDNEYTAHISPDRRVSLHKTFSPDNLQRIRLMADSGNMVVGNSGAEYLALAPVNPAERFVFQPYGGTPIPVSLETVGDRQVICHGQQLLQGGKDKSFEDYPLISRPCDYIVSVTGIDNIRTSLGYLQRMGVDTSLLSAEYFLDVLSDAEQELTPSQKDLRTVYFEVHDRGRGDRHDWRITAYGDDPDRLDADRSLPRFVMRGNAMLYNTPSAREISSGLQLERQILSQPNYVRVNGRDDLIETMNVLKRYGVSFTAETEKALTEAYEQGQLMPRNVAARDRIYLHVKQGIASELDFNLSEFSIDEEPLLEVSGGFFHPAPLYDHDIQNAYLVAGFTADGSLGSFTKVRPGADALKQAQRDLEHLIDMGTMIKPEVVSAHMYEVSLDMQDSVAYRMGGREELAAMLQGADKGAFHEIARFPVTGARGADVHVEDAHPVTDITDTSYSNSDKVMAKKSTAETPEQVQEQQKQQVVDSKEPTGQVQSAPAEKQLRDGVSVFQRKGRDGNLLPGVYGVCVVRGGVRSEVATVSRADLDQYFKDVKGLKGPEAEAVRRALAEKYLTPEGKRIQTGAPAQQADASQGADKVFTLRHASPEKAARITEPRVFRKDGDTQYRMRCIIDGEQQLSRVLSDAKTAAFFNGYKGLPAEEQLQRRVDLAAVVYGDVLRAEKQEESRGMGR